jgi:glucokinase
MTSPLPPLNTAQVIGIDLGGTAIKLGRFDHQGNCLQALTVPTPQPPEPQAVLEAMVEAIAQIDPEEKAIAIGVGTPGPTDATGRIAQVAINLGWKDVPLADWLEHRTGKPTTLANDANCAGLGESWLGAGKRFQDCIMLTLGTGVGGAIIQNGKLFTGRNGTAGELGLITIDLEGHPCNSGNRGSLEQHVSVQAIRRRTGLEPEELGQRAKAGDEEAIAFWHTYGCELGAGIASLLYVLTPEAVILGGGVSASAEFFLPSVWQEIEQRVLPSSREELQILVAELGNQAGIVGAAKLAWDSLGAETTSAAAVDPVDVQAAIALSQFKAGFLARTSHELRSPINSVIGLHQLILNGLTDDPEEEREFIEQAYGAARKMLALMDDLIHVSKLENNTSPLDIQPLCLADILAEIQQLTHLQARNRNLKLEFLHPSDDPYVLADPTALKQALLHLVDAPLAQMQEGFVRVGTEVLPANQQVQIWIEDQRPADFWKEPIDLLSTELPAPAPPLPGLPLLTAQTLLTLLNSTLELVALPTQSSGVTRLQFTLPLVQESD